MLIVNSLFFFTGATCQGQTEFQDDELGGAQPLRGDVHAASGARAVQRPGAGDPRAKKKKKKWRRPLFCPPPHACD